jgi:hypothetical protein
MVAFLKSLCFCIEVQLVIIIHTLYEDALLSSREKSLNESPVAKHTAFPEFQRCMCTESNKISNLYHYHTRLFIVFH